VNPIPDDQKPPEEISGDSSTGRRLFGARTRRTAVGFADVKNADQAATKSARARMPRNRAVNRRRLGPNKRGGGSRIGRQTESRDLIQRLGRKPSLPRTVDRRSLHHDRTYKSCIGIQKAKRERCDSTLASQEEYTIVETLDRKLASTRRGCIPQFSVEDEKPSQKYEKEDKIAISSNAHHWSALQMTTSVMRKPGHQSRVCGASLGVNATARARNEQTTRPAMRGTLRWSPGKDNTRVSKDAS
jgi:hypothetical protein